MDAGLGAEKLPLHLAAPPARPILRVARLHELPASCPRRTGPAGYSGRICIAAPPTGLSEGTGASEFAWPPVSHSSICQPTAR